MRRPLFKGLMFTVVLSALAVGGWALYHSKIGLGLRAQLGQTEGRFLYALHLYEHDDIAGALTTIAPLVASGDVASLNLLCGFVNSYQPVAPTSTDCVKVLENQPVQRLASLTDVAIWAQEWVTAGALIETRLASGDQTAHFDRARLIVAAPAGTFDAADLVKSLELANAAQDPRGQYAAVVSALNVSSAGALSPVLAEILLRRPKISASDAYFELAKLMQTGVISSDLSYVEVLRRADQTGNPNAARYLAQYYIANPSADPTGAEKQAWMAKAAAANDPVAQYNLAITLMNGTADATSMQEAIALLDRSAKAGFVPAMNMLGATLYQQPALLNQPEDEVRAQALGLMEVAAAKDDLNALFNLGNIYLSLQDQPKAIEYLRKGATLGSEPSRSLLEQIGAAAD
jgi:TPR repeat protein